MLNSLTQQNGKLESFRTYSPFTTSQFCKTVFIYVASQTLGCPLNKIHQSHNKISSKCPTELMILHLPFYLPTVSEDENFGQEYSGV